MKAKFRQYGIEITNKQEDAFKKFLEIFIEKNSHINLSSIREADAIIDKHFIDSLMLTKYIKLYGSVADVWTGWGFPGIPLKIYYGDPLEMTFIDSIGKKVKAVEEFCTLLAMKNFTGFHSRWEDLAKKNKHAGAYNFVVSRAVAYFPDLLQYTLPLLKKWGTLIAYKLESDVELDAARDTLKKFHSHIEKVEIYDFLGQKRSLIFVEKD